MKAYYVDDLGLDEDEITDYGKAMRVKIYLASDVDARIAELESAFRYVMSDADRGFGMPDAVKQTIASLMESVTK